MAEDNGSQAPKAPFVEVLPPLGTENEQPRLTNQFEVSGGGVAPLVLEFYYIALNTYRRIFRGGEGENIERVSADHVVFRAPPVSRVAFSPPMAAQLIAVLYDQLHKESDALLVQRVDTQLASIREQRAKEGV
jgi:hypothetical protein